ncbi:uL13 family ribosomal protein, partial [Staphylococcus aureus]
GVYVIVINATQIEFTANNETDKVYYRQSNHPDGIKSITAGGLRITNPERIFEKSIIGMLPSTRLGVKQGKKLLAYGTAEHPQAAQQPENHELRG